MSRFYHVCRETCESVDLKLGNFEKSNMKKLIALGAVLVSPLSALAAPVAQLPTGANTQGTIGYIIAMLGTWVGYIVPVLITLAIGYFIWGVIQFMSASDEEAKKLGRTRIINGLIGLFVIMAFWGIIGVVQRTFGVDSSTKGSSDIITNF